MMKISFTSFFGPALAAMLLRCLPALAGEAGAENGQPGENKAAPESPPAGEAGEEAGIEPKKLPPVFPPLYFFRNKSPLPDRLLLDKREGFYITGFPTIGVNPESGFGYGAALQIFENGPKDSPFFRYTSYRQRYVVMAQGSTENVAKGAVGMDLPYIFNSPYRLRMGVNAFHDPRMNYFGVGEDSMKPLNFPGSPETFRLYDDFKDAISQPAGGFAWDRYDEYDHTEAVINSDLERDLFGGLLRPQIGFRMARIWVDDYTGDSFHGFPMGETHLLNDARTGRIEGFDGGWDNAAKIGITFDTRDFEPDPTKGVLVQTASRLSSKAFGSEFDYAQVAFDARGFQSILKRYTRLVLAGRAMYEIQYGDVPFYSMPTIPLTDQSISGLGGWETLRGFPASRFVGEAAVLLTGEIRWSFVDFDLWSQHLKLGLAPFVDIGRAFDKPSSTTCEDWKIDGGIGLRLAWNLSTLVSFDYGVSEEGHFFFMNLGMQF
jgi:hypothetical protein